MLKTILRNLIANGIKFSHPDGDISVAAVTNDHKVKVSVADQGIGIEKDALDQILDKENSYTTQGTRGEKGSGLGLDLCIDFIEKHNGEIWVDSEPVKEVLLLSHYPLMPDILYSSLALAHSNHIPAFK